MSCRSWWDPGWAASVSLQLSLAAVVQERHHHTPLPEYFLGSRRELVLPAFRQRMSTLADCQGSGVFSRVTSARPSSPAPASSVLNLDTNVCQQEPLGQNHLSPSSTSAPASCLGFRLALGVVSSVLSHCPVPPQAGQQAFLGPPFCNPISCLAAPS